MLAEAQARGMSLAPGQIRNLVLQAVRRNPPPGNVWHDRFGNGRIDAAAAINAVIAEA